MVIADPAVLGEPNNAAVSLRRRNRNEKRDPDHRGLRTSMRSCRVAGGDREGAIRSEPREVPKTGSSEREEEKGNLRDKRLDPWRKANGPVARRGADLAELAKMHSFSEASEPGPGGAHRQMCETRAEKSHPKVTGGDTGGRPRCGAAMACNRPCRPA